MKTLLILTQYFPPEIGAPQNRLYELAIRLQKMGISVSILTALPNYPKMEKMPGYHAGMKETMEGLTVYRAGIYVSKSRGLFSRLMNYFSFVWTSAWRGIFSVPRHEILLVESPPLFLGISAWLISRLRGSKMVFNVSDLWPESAEKLGLVKNRFFLRCAGSLERCMYKSAWKITGQTRGIVQNISSRFPDKKIHWLPNGVDLSLYDPLKKTGDWRSTLGFLPDDKLFLYAGILGHAQGLEVILKAASRLKMHDKVKFILLGDGPEKLILMEMAGKEDLKNVRFLDPVPKEAMLQVLAAVDAAIIPLRKLDLFLGAIPSKIFEAISMEIPIILGVDGEARTLFIEEGRCGLYFSPEDDAALAVAIRTICEDPELAQSLGRNGRIYARRRFDRDAIASDFYTFLQSDID